MQNNKPIQYAEAFLHVNIPCDFFLVPRTNLGPGIEWRVAGPPRVCILVGYTDEGTENYNPGLWHFGNILWK